MARTRSASPSKASPTSASNSITASRRELMSVEPQFWLILFPLGSEWITVRVTPSSSNIWGAILLAAPLAQSITTDIS